MINYRGCISFETRLSLHYKTLIHLDLCGPRFCYGGGKLVLSSRIAR